MLLQQVEDRIMWFMVKLVSPCVRIGGLPIAFTSYLAPVRLGGFRVGVFVFFLSFAILWREGCASAVRVPDVHFQVRRFPRDERWIPR